MWVCHLQFENLDDGVQGEFETFLEERGINSSLALFIPDLAEFKQVTPPDFQSHARREFYRLAWRAGAVADQLVRIWWRRALSQGAEGVRLVAVVGQGLPRGISSSERKLKFTPLMIDGLEGARASVGARGAESGDSACERALGRGACPTWLGLGLRRAGAAIGVRAGAGAGWVGAGLGVSFFALYFPPLR